MGWFFAGFVAGIISACGLLVLAAEFLLACDRAGVESRSLWWRR